MSFMDDFGNSVQSYEMPHDTYMARYYFLKGRM